MSGTWQDVRLRMFVNFPVADPIGDSLRANAIAYWKMDEDAHLTRSDSSPNNLDMIYQGGTLEAVTGKVSNALSCVDDVAKLLVSDVSGIASPGNTNYGFSFWFRMSGAQSNGFGYIFSRMDSGLASGFEYAIWLEDYGVNEYYLVFDPQFGYVGNTSFGILAFETWYFAIIEYDADLQKMRVRINNSSLDEANLSTPNTQAGDTIFFGRSQNASFLGQVDEFLMKSGLFTETERDYIYNSGAGSTQTWLPTLKPKKPIIVDDEILLLWYAMEEN